MERVLERLDEVKSLLLNKNSISSNLFNTITNQEEAEGIELKLNKMEFFMQMVIIIIHV